MKNKLKSLILLFMLISSVSIAQELNHSDLKSLTKSKVKFTTYIGKDGGVYKVGDKLTLGLPTGLQGVDRTFTYVNEGALLLTPVSALNAGNSTEIKSFALGGTRRSGFYVIVRSKGFIGISNYSIDLENAITAGEVVSTGMTSDQALSELKKAKDKLDLGLITQEEYDAIRAEMAKIIK